MVLTGATNKKRILRQLVKMARSNIFVSIIQDERKKLLQHRRLFGEPDTR